MNFIIANDHAAVELKREITDWLKTDGHEVIDLGSGPDERVDYPDKAREAAMLFLQGGYDYGILCCGTGIGMSIVANKVQGIRCALPQNCYSASMAREHNNCQFIAFGARIDYPDKPIVMLKAFLDARYDVNSHHTIRVQKMMQIEKMRGIK